MRLSVPLSITAIELEYSLDLGLHWQPLVRDCLPTSQDCSSYTLQRLLVADTYNKWGRVTLPIPIYARSVTHCLTAKPNRGCYSSKSLSKHLNSFKCWYELYYVIKMYLQVSSYAVPLVPAGSV